MVLRRKGKSRLVAGDSDNGVILLSSRDNVVGGQVRKPRKKFILRTLQVAQFLVQYAHFFGEFFHVRENRRHVRAFLLHLWNARADLVAFRLESLNGPDDFSAFAIRIEETGKINDTPLLGQLFRHFVRVVADLVYIQHNSASVFGSMQVL